VSMGAEREYKAMADQLTTAAQERLRNQIGVLTPGEMKAIERRFAEHITQL
jgi:mRNA-degrading endonuclease toxin of MazEF toxin-antitoxin module